MDDEGQQVVEGTETSAVEDFNSIGNIPEPSSEGQPEENSNGYPSTWSEVLNKIPSEFHESVAPALKSWDQGVTSRFEKLHSQYSPYEDFVKNGISADELRASYGIYQNLNSNPTGFFERLRDTLIQQGLYEEAAEVQEKIEADDADEYEDNPLAQQLQQIQQQLSEREQQEQLQQQEYQMQQAVAQAGQQIEQEFTDLESKVGPLSDVLRKAVVDQAWSMQQRTGRDVPLEIAYQNLQNIIAAQTKASSAPRTVSAGGGLPSQKSPDLSDEKARVSAAEQLVQSMINGTS